jgi:aldehyde dehydrogenase (NAD+)
MTKILRFPDILESAYRLSRQTPFPKGHYYGKHGFDALTHAKSMLISPPDSAIAHLLPPYSDARNEELKQWLDY